MENQQITGISHPRDRLPFLLCSARGAKRFFQLFSVQCVNARALRATRQTLGAQS